MDKNSLQHRLYKPDNTPEIRFKGFADAWEQRKFADIGIFFYSLDKQISA